MTVEFKKMPGLSVIPYTDGLPGQTSDQQLRIPEPGRHETFMFVFVTPEIAALWLKRNLPQNRPIDSHTLSLIKTEMQKEQFLINGASICFNLEGYLIDGQKRLTAMVETGMPKWLLVGFDLGEKAVHTIDRGKPRTPADSLHISGEVNSTVLAAMLATMRDLMRDERRVDTRKRSNLDLLEEINLYPGIREYAKLVPKFSGFSQPSTIAAFCYRVSMIEGATEDAAEFKEGLVTGANLEKGSPILLLRKDISDKPNITKLGGRQYLLALCGLAWNKFRRGDDESKRLSPRFKQNDKQFPILR